MFNTILKKEREVVTKFRKSLGQINDTMLRAFCIADLHEDLFDILIETGSTFVDALNPYSGVIKYYMNPKNNDCYSFNFVDFQWNKDAPSYV